MKDSPLKSKANGRVRCSAWLGRCKYTVTLTDDGRNSDACARFLASLGVGKIHANHPKNLAPCKLTIRKHDESHPRGVIIEHVFYFGSFHSEQWKRPNDPSSATEGNNNERKHGQKHI